MGKLSTKHGRSKSTLSMRKTSQKLVTASTGKTNQKLRGATIVKAHANTHPRSLSMAKAAQNSILTCLNSASKVVASSEVRGKAGMRNMPVASQSSYSKVSSGKKVTSHKSTGTVAQLPPPVSKKTGVGSSVPASPCVIWKPAQFLADNLPVHIHLLGSLGPGDWSFSTQGYTAKTCMGKVSKPIGFWRF